MSNLSTSAEQSQKLIVHDLKPLDQSEARYIKPMSFRFTLNGKERKWECLKSHDSVACVIYNRTRQRLVYVKQFRPAVYLSKLTTTPTSLVNFDPSKLDELPDEKTGYTLELCAGLVDKSGKSAQKIMQEEISEETGYVVPVESVKFINSFIGSTGISGSLMKLFFCEVTDDQKQLSGGGIDEENIEVIELHPDEARKIIYGPDEESPYSRPPAMLFGTSWFLNEYLNNNKN